MLAGMNSPANQRRKANSLRIPEQADEYRAAISNIDIFTRATVRSGRPPGRGRGWTFVEAMTVAELLRPQTEDPFMELYPPPGCTYNYPHLHVHSLKRVL